MFKYKISNLVERLIYAFALAFCLFFMLYNSKSIKVMELPKQNTEMQGMMK